MRGVELRAPPGDRRGFIHRKGSFLRRIGKKVLGGVPIIGGIATGFGEALGLFEGATGGQAGCPPGMARNIDGNCENPRNVGFRPQGTGVRQFGGFLQGGTECPPGFFKGPFGSCVQLPVSVTTRIGIPPPPPRVGGGPRAMPDQFGEAVLGRFGPALEPEVLSVTHRRCPRGAVLGVDGLCYNRGEISNKQRFWPRGRRPLLTGGEMRCISVASKAAGKLQRKQKQLQDLGLLKKPATRTRAAPKALTGVPRVVQIQQE